MKLLLSLFISIVSFSLISQNDYPQNLFVEPMDLPIELSGSFSELRSVNFHSGIDLRVLNKPNRNVYAVGDGYVSRIVVEEARYGNALYITHPQGYISVYAHLDSFSNDISEIVKSIQYEQQSFAVDLSLPEDFIMVKKKQIIGIAGNKGYSFGPHLHFEIREAETNEPIDPMSFGFRIYDNSPPVFRELKIYPHGNSLINNFNSEIIYKTTKNTSGKFIINSTPVVSGAVSFGFNINDKQNSSNPNRLGLKKINVFVDDTLFLDIQFDRTNFSTVRHQLAYIDYPERERTKKRFQRTWKKPGNNLGIYKYIKDDGVLYISEDKEYVVRCEIFDIGNNKQMLEFVIKGELKDGINNFSTICDSLKTLLKWGENFIYKEESFEVKFFEYSLFSDNCVLFEELKTNITSFSNQVNISCDEALADYYTIRIKPFEMIDDTSKLVIARIDDKNKLIASKTVFNEGFFEAQTRSYGSYVIVIDTISPSIKTLNIPLNGVVTRLNSLSFIVKDEICGIEKFDAYINGEWVLLEYDLKNNKMFYIIDEKLPFGNSTLKIIVSDCCGNKSVWERNIIR